jgi:hypothetical protein
MVKDEPKKFASLKDALKFCESIDNNRITAYTQEYQPARTTEDKKDVAPEHWIIKLKVIQPYTMNKVQKWITVSSQGSY